MSVISKIVTIKFTKDNTEIENELSKMGINPLRWAVVGIKDSCLNISVSFEN